MTRWLILLGGPLIWAAHFGAVYFIASVSVLLAGQTTLPARLAILGCSLAATGAASAFVLWCGRSGKTRALGPFWRSAGIAGGAIALAAVVWQTLPALAPL